MKTVALFSQKGGAGKTTISVHLAVAAQASGLRVAILDLDPQGSALAWHKTRGAESMPVTIPISADQAAAAFKTAKADGFDLLLLDCPPHATLAASQILAAVDFVLVPVRPSPMDIAALPATMRLIGSNACAFVLSACPARAPEIEETRALLDQYKRPVFGPITDRRQFFRAITAGQAVSEFEPDGPAAAEITALFQSLTEQIK